MICEEETRWRGQRRRNCRTRRTRRPRLVVTGRFCTTTIHDTRPVAYEHTHTKIFLRRSSLTVTNHEHDPQTNRRLPTPSPQRNRYRSAHHQDVIHLTNELTTDNEHEIHRPSSRRDPHHRCRCMLGAPRPSIHPNIAICVLSSGLQCMGLAY